jgi:vitamin B12 transporter
MKKLLLLFLFASQIVMAQTKISGKVTDNKGQTIPGANVVLKDSYDGTSTAANGTFSFTTTETGDATILVSFLGYENFEQKVKLAGTEIVIKAMLKEKSNELNIVTISAGTIEASDSKKAVMLRPLDIVTTAGAQGDINGAIQTLPGVQPIGETEGLFVRGGAASETKTIIDGITVPHPYFSSVPDIAQRGRFSPFLFKGTVFSTGGYSAQYGQALSSALILDTQDIPDQTSTNIGIMSVGGQIGHNHRWKNTSVGFDVNYSNLAPYFSLVKQNTDWKRYPQSGGASFIFRQKMSLFSSIFGIGEKDRPKNGLLKVYATQSYSDLALRSNDIDTVGKTTGFALKNDNFYANVSYKEPVGDKWSVYAGGSYAHNKDSRTIGIFKNEQQVFTFNPNSADEAYQGKAMLTRQIGRLSSLRFGNETQLFNYTGITYRDANGNYFYGNNILHDRYVSNFIETDLFITHKLVTRIGGREEYSSQINKINIAPRTSIAYKTGNSSQVSFAYGDFYQNPDIQYLVQNVNKNLTYEKASHYIANYQVVEDNSTFRVELYYKKYDDLVKSVPTLANTGNGYAQGIDVFMRNADVFLKKLFPSFPELNKSKRTDYWISYSYLDTKRNYAYYSTSATPIFAAKNTFSVVYKRQFSNNIKLFNKDRNLLYSIGLTYTYASGRPYFNPNNTAFLGDRTKDFHNLSANLSYLTNIGGHFTVVALSCSNVLGIDNVYGYRYSLDGTRREALGSTAPRFFFIGMFINIGQDKFLDN